MSVSFIQKHYSSYIESLINRKAMYCNEELVNGLVERDQEVIVYIYSNFFPGICKWIILNNGTEEESHDIFHEAILIIYRKLETEIIQVNCKFNTYLFSICKHLWFRELRRKNRFCNDQKIEDVGKDVTEEAYLLEEKLFSLLHEHLDRLDPKGKEVILLSLNGESLRNIKERLGFKNNQAVADKKKNCKKKLICSLLECEEFKRLINEIYNTN